MKKKWVIVTLIGIVFFILIKFIFIPKIMIFCDIYTTLQQSKHELYDKQKELVQKEIVKINYNGNEINEDEPLAFMVRQIEFSKSKISMNTKEKNYNNSLEFITDGNEKIEFNFYFNSECSNNYIEVKKGMITIEANKLCEYLKKYD